MRSYHPLVRLSLALIGAAAFAAALCGDPFTLRVASRAAILAIAALSLDFIVGYGGMVSFGHAAFIGLGAYCAGILTMNGLDSLVLAMPAAMLCGALAAGMIGLVALRTSGIHFIMITLAFAQMLFFAVISIDSLGGMDGLPISRRMTLPGLNLDDHLVFFLVCCAFLALTVLLLGRMTHSRFGRLLVAIRDNEEKAVTTGFNTFPYRLAAFAAAGALGSAAGVLHANLNNYVSPDAMSWVLSGDLLVMIAIGGSAALMGPISGAAVFVLLEVVLSEWVTPWTLAFGPLLVLLVLYAKGGLVNWRRNL